MSFFQKIHRILKPAGWVVGTTPNINSWDEKIFKKYWGLYHMPRHIYLFEPLTLTRMFEQLGFSHISYPNNAVSGFGISLQNVLRRNKKHSGEYKKIWFFPYVNILTMPFSYMASLINRNSTLDFIVEKKGRLR